MYVKHSSIYYDDDGDGDDDGDNGDDEVDVDDANDHDDDNDDDDDVVSVTSLLMFICSFTVIFIE